MNPLEKLSNILDYEFNNKRKRMMDFEKSYSRIHINLKDVKEDVDVEEFIYQLKKNLAYDNMRKIDQTHFEVKELIKKRKINEPEDVIQCSHPQGICKCKIPLELPQVIVQN